MKHYLIILFTWLAYLFLPHLEALNRDYQSDCEKDDTYQNYYYPYCLYHAPDPEWTQPELLNLIPATGPKCNICSNPSIYLGYIDIDFDKYIRHLEHQLNYSDQHSGCHCLWPEYSKESAKISDTAYILFRDLIATTALSNLIDDKKAQRDLVQNEVWFLNIHGLSISFIVQQFRFSDYYRVCRDIETFAVSNYEEKETAIIKDKLQDILEALFPKFFELYISCYKKHPNSDIDQEIRFMKLLVNDISALATLSKSTPSLEVVQNSDTGILIIANLQTINHPVKLEGKGVFNDNETLKRNYDNVLALNNSMPMVLSNNHITSAFQPEFVLEKGALLNDLLLYKEAIKVLTQVIQHNSSNRDAYIERAMAYFETNQLSLALKDYESAKKLTIVPPFKLGSLNSIAISAIYIPENKTEFSRGLVSGTVDGANISVVEFVPSIFSCCRGILNGLWAFACSPIEVSQELLNAAYAMGEFVNNHNTKECFECVVPELRELSLSWDVLNDYSKGQKIGFIIGKYGVDIFAPVGIVKGMSKVRALKRANTMYTLESCSVSQAKQTKISEQSIKRASIREQIISESVRGGKILIRNSNTEIHIMQPKHAWDKLVKISGKIEEDTKKVIKLLEDNQIILEKYRLNPSETFEKYVRYNHQMKINGHEVKAVFNKNIETGEVFLNDAWVITK